VTENKDQGITRAEKNNFLTLIAEAMEEYKPGQPMPEIEVPRKVIEHFNRSHMGNFNDVHYFVYHNVRVYEEGKRDIFKRQEKMSLEDKVFGGFRR